MSGEKQDNNYWRGYPEGLRGLEASRKPVAASHPQGFSDPMFPGQRKSGLRKSHISAGLLAIFLGCLGMHKFYLGYYSVGFTMLAITIVGSILTLGLAGLAMFAIGIVEGAIYLLNGQRLFEYIYLDGRRKWF